MPESCPFKSSHSQEWLDKMMIKSDDHSCPARKCKILKDYIDKPVKGSYSGKCQFLQSHPCPYFEKMIQK